MIITADPIAGVLADAWPGTRLGAEPESLPGGFWAAMYRLRLSGQPPGVPADVVLRLAPQQEMGVKEVAVQAAVAAQGFPTPAVHLQGRGAPFAGPWAVMDFVPGAPPLAALAAGSVVRQAPALLRRLPAQLADTMAALHALDAGPVTEAVRAAAPTVAWHVSDLFAHLEAGAGAVGRPDLAVAVRVLASTQPDEGRPVVCHGDFHPFNVLVAGDHVTVVDWTAALCAQPAYDVAFTALLLRNPPLAAPAAVGAGLRLAGASMARRFVSRYRRAHPSGALDALDWYTALHCAHILIDAAALTAEHGAGAGGHPWHLLAPVAARHLTKVTGARTPV